VSDEGSADPPSLHQITSEGRRRARRLAWLYTAAAVVLLPWIAFLALSLPRRQFDLHYRAAWVGFDVLLVTVIIRTAYMAFRVDQRVQFAATATATLLIVDAWFDMTTSGSHAQFFEAFVLAVFVEIPAAAFSIYVARQVNRRALEAARLAGSASVGAAPNRSYRRRRSTTTKSTTD
jgi:hypothetical protein